MKICPECEGAALGDGWLCTDCGWNAAIKNGIPLLAPRLETGNDGFDPEGHKVLAELESHSFWFLNRNALLGHVMKRYFPDARTYLEVGCGTGFVLAEMARKRDWEQITATDVYLSGLEFAASRVPEAQILQSDITSLPFKEEFDVVGAFDVLEHVEKDEKALASVFRTLKPGGGLLVTVPQHMWLWSRQDELAFHKRRYTRSQLVGKLERAGFEVVRATSFVSFLLPLMALARLRFLLSPGASAGDATSMSEFNIPGHLNTLLGVVCAIERYLIEKRVSFRAGGSLLIIARRMRV